jgi:phosphoglycolate phosphatase-like HAD superfamily hydrolase
MHLVVFDIDGTLTDTCEVDHGCYWGAIHDVFRIAADQPDWSTFRHVTDSGIACESCERYLGRPANEREIDAVRQRLVMLLESALVVKNPVNYQIPGAFAVLSLIRESPDLAAALATGGFRASAELKLRRAGLLDPSVPFASSDDALSREQIMRIAADRAAKKYMVEFSGFTFIGDGVWDVRAARNLGWTFIGIGAGENAERLRRAGADTIIPDYNPIARFLSILRRSRERAT